MKRFFHSIWSTSLVVALTICTVGYANDELTHPTGAGEILEPEEERTARLPFELSGFWEVRMGFRTQEDKYEKDASIGETRLQLEIEKHWERLSFDVTSDFLYDPVMNKHDIKLEEGEGFIDLREANVTMTPVSFMDVKIGRQILTWGTGGLIFVNDLFPKDWNSFVIGRDVEYLKAPSDALKVGLYSDLANLEVVYTPRFDMDRIIDGRRVSYWNGGLGRRAGRDAVVEVERPDDWLQDDEIALRLYRYIGSYKSPTGGSGRVPGVRTRPLARPFSPIYLHTVQVCRDPSQGASGASRSHTTIPARIKAERTRSYGTANSVSLPGTRRNLQGTSTQVSGITSNTC